MASNLVQRMFDKIIHSPTAYFRSQQKDEPDLDVPEKYSICSSLYHERPVQFLARYYQFLDIEDIICFQHLQERHSASAEDMDYEIDYYLNDMSTREPVKTGNGIRPNQKSKNRRYSALKRLIAEGNYFSDYEMRYRDPLLYEEMIGQYQTEAEQRTAFHHDNQRSATFSAVLLDLYDAKELSTRRHQQLVNEQMTDRLNRLNCQTSDHSDVEEDDEETNPTDMDQSLADSRHRGKAISLIDKQQLREEFIREMQERFLEGKDMEFDYRTVDENPEYDLVEMQARDAEDKYFDEEEPEDYFENGEPTNDQKKDAKGHF